MSMNRIKGLLFWVLAIWPAVGSTAVDSYFGKIRGVLSDSENFGNCMVLTNYEPTIECPNEWISLDCKGSYNSKENTRRMWDTVLLGKALDASVFIVVNDAKKHNGYCVAERVDVYN